MKSYFILEDNGVLRESDSSDFIKWRDAAVGTRQMRPFDVTIPEIRATLFVLYHGIVDVDAGSDLWCVKMYKIGTRACSWGRFFSTRDEAMRLASTLHLKIIERVNLIHQDIESAFGHKQ